MNLFVLFKFSSWNQCDRWTWFLNCFLVAIQCDLSIDVAWWPSQNWSWLNLQRYFHLHPIFTKNKIICLSLFSKLFSFLNLSIIVMSFIVAATSFRIKSIGQFGTLRIQSDHLRLTKKLLSPAWAILMTIKKFTNANAKTQPRGHMLCEQSEWTGCTNKFLHSFPNETQCRKI